mgnify:CR=1 FL=1
MTQKSRREWSESQRQAIFEQEGDAFEWNDAAASREFVPRPPLDALKIPLEPTEVRKKIYKLETAMRRKVETLCVEEMLVAKVVSA